MPIYRGNTELSNVYLGATELSQVYLRQQELLSGGSGIPTAIIAATGTNNTTGPNVCNIYYRRHIIAFVYTAAELQSALGTSSGEITGLRFNVTSQPANQPLPDYAIGVKQGTFSGTPGNTGYTIIKSPSSESFTAGTYKEFTLTNTFNWTGGDLAFVFAWGQCPVTYSASGQSPIGSGTVYYSLNDGPGAFVINVDSFPSTAPYRPVIELTVQ